MKNKPTAEMNLGMIQGRLFKVYFESLYEKPKPGEKATTSSCLAIASNAEEAIEIVRAAFPGEHINSIFSDTSFGVDRVRPGLEQIVFRHLGNEPRRG